MLLYIIVFILLFLSQIAEEQRIFLRKFLQDQFRYLTHLRMCGVGASKPDKVASLSLSSWS